MKIVETSTGKEYPIEILPVEKDEFKTLTKERYFFDWKIERNQEVYKLQLLGSRDILGLVSLERIPGDFGSICATDFGAICASDFGSNCAIL